MVRALTATPTVSTVCTDTSRTDHPLDDDSKEAFEHFFYNPGSDDGPMGDWESQSPAEESPSPHTPPDEMAMLVGDGPTVRYVPAKEPATEDDGSLLSITL